MADIADFEITKHALQRALDMGVEGSEIRQCLLHPESVRKSRKHPGYNYRAGRITCAVKDKRVITVVWSSPDDWRADIETYGLYKGREFRGRE